MNALKTMTGYIRRNGKLWLFALLVPALASLATNVFYADRMKKYSELLLMPQGDFGRVAGLMLWAIVMLLMLSAIDDAGRYAFLVFAAATEKELRKDVYARVVRAPVKKIQSFHQGELVTRYNKDVERSVSIAAHDIQGLAYPLIVGMGYLAAVLLSDAVIGLIMLGLGAGVILLNFLFLKKSMVIQSEMLCGDEEFTMNCGNAIRGRMSVRQYGAEEMMTEKIRESAEQLLREECRAACLQAVKRLTSGGLADICDYFLTPLACLLAARGYIAVPTVLFIHQVCRYFIKYTQNFAVMFSQYRADALSCDRVRELLELPDEAGERGGTGGRNFPEKADVSFEGVSVSYGERRVLQNITFSLHPGEIVGIEGESGSGKSTLVKALLQMVEYQGRISVGGEDCSGILLEELRENIAFSPEHSELFHDTVWENIGFGNRKAGAEEIKAAASRAALTDGEEFFNRDAGEKGCRLSGGQRQRVSLARAFLKDARVVILDEPTAALDAESEARVLEAVLKLKEEGKCILIISHRASTLGVADRILRLEGGRVSLRR